jgi:hypothetical protein
MQATETIETIDQARSKGSFIFPVHINKILNKLSRLTMIQAYELGNKSKVIRFLT